MNNYFKTNLKISSIIHLFFCLLSIISTNTQAFEKDNDNLNDHLSILFLDKETQTNLGLKTQRLKKIKFNYEEILFGKAINIEPLLNLSNQFHAVSADQNKAKWRITQARELMSHLKNLHKGAASIPRRKLQKQQALIQFEQINYKESTRQRDAIAQKSKLYWGNTPTKWITNQSSLKLEKLVNGETTLLKILLPEQYSIQKENNQIFISPIGNRNSAFIASFISRLPQVENTSQGLQYLYQTDGSKIKAGMNFTAWISNKQKNQLGIVIPQSSVVWHLGQSFVFIKIKEEQFIQKNLTSLITVSQGYFVQSPLKEGNEIVISGAQTLLSHELKSQIPDEDDD